MEFWAYGNTLTIHNLADLRESAALPRRALVAYRWTMTYDVVIAGGGPAGLAAALTLGRSRRRVLLCDAGPRRNAAAVHIQNFVTRDGITPAEFRRIGREQLAAYPNVEIRDVLVEEIRGTLGAFDVRLSGDDASSVHARFVLLCTGMIDELPEIEGLRELWGTSVFICPYCHAWEIQDRRFAFLAFNAEALEFALLLRGWTRDVVVLTNGRFAIDQEQLTPLTAAGVRIDERQIARLAGGPAIGDGLATGSHHTLERIEFVEGSPLACDALFVRPPQRQIPLVASLGLTLDDAGRIKVDQPWLTTSIPGIYAAGDLVTPAQGALIAAASGTMTAAMLNRSLALELAVQGALA
jgi:thioredoxin reductase